MSETVLQMIETYTPHSKRHDNTVEMKTLNDWMLGEIKKLETPEMLESFKNVDSPEVWALMDARMRLINKYEALKKKIYIMLDRRQNRSDDGPQKNRRNHLITINFKEKPENADCVLVDKIKCWLAKNDKKQNFTKWDFCIEYGITGSHPHAHICISTDPTRLVRLRPADCRNSLLSAFKGFCMDIRVEKASSNYPIEYIKKDEHEHYLKKITVDKYLMENYTIDQIACKPKKLFSKDKL